ncbi:hypothetical protein ABMA70_00105 [Halobacteriovorax sp. XZX-3]|uniref:hypothetical protein n=1 Tax=unclassified Halobacteriovorax TaxID=2639665 RepID=UPI000CD127C5|nr:hypothetical protein [Halobacteriovorax sp. DA5]POB14175.1 hypothetical protein C0Z22_03545 [Halobacteriovorax sp. DA5]
MSIFNRNKAANNSTHAFESQKYKQTFTYFIPSPPARSTPYQEKAFDQVTQFLNAKEMAYHIAHTAVNDKGLWVIIEIFGKQKEVTKLIQELNDSFNSSYSTESDSELEIYYEENEEFHKDDNYKA